jgi:hypothetical protein
MGQTHLATQLGARLGKLHRIRHGAISIFRYCRSGARGEGRWLVWCSRFHGACSRARDEGMKGFLFLRRRHGGKEVWCPPKILVSVVPAKCQRVARQCFIAPYCLVLHRLANRREPHFALCPTPAVISARAGWDRVTYFPTSASESRPVSRICNTPAQQHARTRHKVPCHISILIARGQHNGSTSSAFTNT